jgi:hypothetical protein
MPTCPVCAQDNPDIARFCLACGAALGADAMREERKVVTVLFADLVGFTSRAVRLLAAQQLAEAGRAAEADRQLQRALAFYRAVGATHVVRRAESLAAPAQSRP